MSEKSNAGLEKIFFLHILMDDPSQFTKVDVSFFKNDDIQFVYKIVRDEYIVNTKKTVPTPTQILAMVRLNDPEKKVSDNLLKMLLKGDNSEYDVEKWVLPRFKAWKLSNSLKNNALKTIEFIRGIDEINYDNVVDITGKIKTLFSDISLIESDDSDLGADFDDYESHQITSSTKKLPTGWSCIDTIMGGGWDQATLNILMAQPGGGKCCHYDTKISIKNKITNKIEEISIGEFFNKISLFSVPGECIDDSFLQHKSHDRKFEETYKIDDYQIMTDKGWKDIFSIGKTIPYIEWKIKTENYELICADTHIIFDENFSEKYIKDIKIGDKIQTKSGIENVLSIVETDKISNMYDIQMDENTDKRFYTNGILSHNSMFMQNMAVKAADQGFNCAYITLEMGSQKCMKRMGAMRLLIPANDYDSKAQDSIFMKNKLNGLKNLNGGMFNFTPGKIFVKKYSTSDCSVTDIDNYIHKLEETKKIKINLVFVDYINLMSLEKGLDFQNMLFLKGKHFAEGLRYVADKYNCCIVAGTQTDKDIWDASDIALNNVPESKAVAETADSVWGIIRNPLMKKNNVYRLKILKLRDGEHKGELINFDFDPEFLLMKNDEFVGNA